MSDTQGIIAPKQTANIPAISSGSTAIESNTARGKWHIQNLGINALFVRLGSGASTSLFHFVLKGGATQDDGQGGSVGQDAGTIYTGVITVAGNSKRYTILEL